MDAGCTALQSPGSRRDTIQRGLWLQDALSRYWIGAHTHLLAVWLGSHAALARAVFFPEIILIGRVDRAAFYVTLEAKGGAESYKQNVGCQPGISNLVYQPSPNRLQRAAPLPFPLKPPGKEKASCRDGKEVQSLGMMQ